MERSEPKDTIAYAYKLFRRKAARLIGNYGFVPDDLEDLMQDMMEDLMRRWPKHDPSKASLRTFVSRLADRKIANIIRDRKREKRDYSCNVYSRDQPVKNEDGSVTIHDEIISQDNCNLLMGKYTSSEIERADMHLDVWSAISELPEHLQEVAELLMGHSVSGAARELGLHRDTLYRSRMVQLREVFEDKGLKDYL